MKLLIQHNFITGLGDMYVSVTQYLEFANDYKNRGYETELVVCFRGNKYIDIIDFSEIFDMEYFNVFDKISYVKTPILTKKYEDMSYVFTANLMVDPKPGQQDWDVFLSVDDDNLTIPNSTTYRLLVDNNLPKIKPKFSKEIIEKSNGLSNQIGVNYNYLQIRMNDEKRLTEDDFKMLELFHNKIIQTNDMFHIGSNSHEVLNFFRDKKNVFTYGFKSICEYDSNHNYFAHTNLTNEEYIERLKENIVEMVSIKNAKKIYQYSEIFWISQFLFYSFVEQIGNINFYRINNKFETISYI